MYICELYMKKGTKIPYLEVRENEVMEQRPYFFTPGDFYNALNGMEVTDLFEEKLYIFPLNVRNRLTGGLCEVSKGGRDYSVVDVKSIFTRLLLCGASRFAVVHNHPSGDPTPSGEDKEVCKKLKEASNILDIEMIDFLIVCEDSYFSFKTMNMM